MVSENEKVDALLRIADFQREFRRERRTHEWAITAALWLLLGGAVAQLREVPRWLLAPAAIILVIGHAELWVRPNFVKNQRDIRNAFDNIHEAERIIHDKPDTQQARAVALRRPDNGRLSYLLNPVSAFGVMVTAVLAGAAIYASGLPKEMPVPKAEASGVMITVAQPPPKPSSSPPLSTPPGQLDGKAR